MASQTYRFLFTIQFSWSSYPTPSYTHLYLILPRQERKISAYTCRRSRFLDFPFTFFFLSSFHSSCVLHSVLYAKSSSSCSMYGEKKSSCITATAAYLHMTIAHFDKVVCVGKCVWKHRRMRKKKATPKKIKGEFEERNFLAVSSLRIRKGEVKLVCIWGMFYFSIDNKEEMFIRSASVQAAHTIHY